MRRRALPVSTLLAALWVSLFSSWAAVPAHAGAHTDYMLQCQGCHGSDGRGSPGSVPDLRDRIGLFADVRGGRRFLIGVPGSAQSPLSNGQLAEVLNWMIREFGPAEVSKRFAPFSEQEVGRHRKALSEVAPIRKSLIEQIAAVRRGPGDPGLSRTSAKISPNSAANRNAGSSAASPLRSKP